MHATSHTLAPDHILLYYSEGGVHVWDFSFALKKSPTSIRIDPVMVH